MQPEHAPQPGAPPPSSAAWATGQPLWKRLLAGLVVAFAPVLPALGAGLFTAMMMAFMADAGMPNESLSEAAVTVSMAGLAMGASLGAPIAVGILIGRGLRPFLVVAGVLFGLGAVFYLGGFVVYFLSLTR